jgi:2,3-bisphosphoglycerate-independent phosphoglycerate mutase
LVPEASPAAIAAGLAAGCTPLEAAQIPSMDSIVETGRIGTVRTVPEGFTPGTDVATMSLLGYDVRKHYTGRAPIEAVSQNVRLRPEDVVFRCNLVNISNGEMTDFTAGHIQTAEAGRFAANLLPIIRSIQSAGPIGMVAIAKLLNDRGVRTARGGQWHVLSVANLLARANNCVANR